MVFKIEAVKDELQQKVTLREEDMDKTEERLSQATQTLKEATLTGDECER